MADFDDILSKSRPQPSVPVFDNPFQDVFEGVSGRPRSPDPWSTGGWGDPDPAEAAFTPAAAAPSFSPPTSPGGFKDYSQAQSYEPEVVREQHSPPPEDEDQAIETRPSAEESPLDSVDPLGSNLAETDEVPHKRNPLGPLPPPPKLQDLPPPEPALPDEPKQATAVPPAKEDVPIPEVIEPEPLTQTAADDASTTTATASTIDVPKVPAPAREEANSPLDPNSLPQLPRVVPPIPPSPLTPHSPAPSGISSFRDRSISESTSADSNASLTATDSTRDIRYGRIVSPLETPPGTLAKRSSLEQGFSNLALGGEMAGGWGGSAPITPQTAGFDGRHEDPAVGVDADRTHDTISPAQSVATVKEDGDDLLNDQSDLTPPQPTFVITVGDPQKVGDPISAHIVYTVHTRTTSPAFSKSSFSVLRRYSDFLWLYETLSANNPGVIVPPVPEKNPFNVSRFEADFVESRRLGLNKCVQKIANHPVLNKDGDFRFFLESDSFALDIKHRRTEGSQAGGILGTLGSLTGPRFYEIDDWFDHKRAYLDALESQLKGLVKAIEIVSKQRADFAVTVSEFADAIGALSQSDLSKQLTTSLAVLADVERLYRDMLDSQAKDDMITVMGTADEYSRLINSVRLAFNSRVKLYFAWQSADTEARRVKSMQEKARRQGRTTGSMAEIAEADRRALEAKAEFDTVTRLIKLELGRFESERIEDFKISLEQFLESMIRKQKALISSWENYQNVLLKRADSNPTNAVTEDGDAVEDI